MLTWLSQNIGTIVVIAILALFFGLLIRGLIRDKKAGKGSCGGGCAGCANACYCHGHTPASDPVPTESETGEATTPETQKGGC